MTDVAAGISFYGRAQEVEVTLLDGVLLLKALDTPLQFLGTLDPQTSFRLAQSRMQLQLDQRPTQDFSKMLLVRLLGLHL